MPSRRANVRDVAAFVEPSALGGVLDEQRIQDVTIGVAAHGHRSVPAGYGNEVGGVVDGDVLDARAVPVRRGPGLHTRLRRRSGLRLIGRDGIGESEDAVLSARQYRTVGRCFRDEDLVGKVVDPHAQGGAAVDEKGSLELGGGSFRAVARRELRRLGGEALGQNGITVLYGFSLGRHGQRRRFQRSLFGAVVEVGHDYSQQREDGDGCDHGCLERSPAQRRSDEPFVSVAPFMTGAMRPQQGEGTEKQASCSEAFPQVGSHRGVIEVILLPRLVVGDDGADQSVMRKLIPTVALAVVGAEQVDRLEAVGHVASRPCRTLHGLGPEARSRDERFLDP